MKKEKEKFYRDTTRHREQQNNFFPNAPPAVVLAGVSIEAVFATRVVDLQYLRVLKVMCFN